MAKVVVELPDKDIELIQEVYDKELIQPLYGNIPYIIKLARALVKAVVKGCILPKGHGRLIDGDALKEKMICTQRYFHIKYDIDEAPTVIEADKDGKKDEKDDL